MAMAQKTSLPPPQANQTYVVVSAIEGGFITLQESLFVSPNDPSAARTVPSLAFLIEHPGSDLFKNDGSDKAPVRMMFDLGLRSELPRYMQQQQAHLVHRQPYRLGPGVVKHLRDGGLTPADIGAVVLSHVHYDHHGDPEEFEESTFIVGPGSQDILQNGLPDIRATHQCFDPNLLPKDRTVELPIVSKNCTKSRMLNGITVDWSWSSVGPFPSAIDIFGDSSVYIIDAPGHLPGHVNLLCRVSETKWVYLGGDACHDIRLLTGEREIGTWQNAHGETMCIHLDRNKAEESLKNIRQLMEPLAKDGQEVEIILAHDDIWFERNKTRMYPNHL
jgi:glyoxylase-like metal-dependent hydrolase (beta-lactamase superfamily II)